MWHGRARASRSQKRQVDVVSSDQPASGSTSAHDDLMSMLFPDRSSKLKLTEWQGAWMARIVGGGRELVNRCAFARSLARSHPRTHGVYIRVYIHRKLAAAAAAASGPPISV